MSTTPNRLRVLTYNIHRGIGMDQKMDLARTAAFIRALDPDVVALQEIDVKTRRSQGVHQPAELGKLAGMHPFFGEAMPYDGGYYGECVLSKHPVRRLVVHALPADTGYEPRAMVEIEIAPFKDQPAIVFFGTHLDHEDTPTQRLAQTKRMNEILEKRTDPWMILAGDMNDLPKSEPIAALRKIWTDAGPFEKNAWTYPADKPDHKIDYIFYRGTRTMKVVECKILEEPMISDHRPVLAVFEM